MIYWIFSFVLTAIDTWCVLYLLDTFLKKKDAKKREDRHLITLMAIASFLCLGIIAVLIYWLETFLK